MDQVGLVLEQFVDAFYYISLSQHQLVLHFSLYHERVGYLDRIDFRRVLA